MSVPRRSWRTPSAAVAAVVGACALCCAGPLLAILGGLGIAGLLGAFWLRALLIVTVLAVVGGALLALRRRRAGACTWAQVGPVDLATPTVFTRDR